MAASQSEENHHLIGLARRRAFETYLRYGRMPADASRTAERKAVNPAMPIPAPLPARATSYYVWRSAGDDRVRHSHAARHGQVFAWAEPPEGGHPGTEPNCRCWPEPYYGDPSVPDALQPLAHHHQVGDGTTVWFSIETLTRPDGSLAQSSAISRDGTQIRSRFQATSIARTVTLANGQVVRIDTDSGLQSIFLGNDGVPQFQSRWTIGGPKVVRARQHLAFLLDSDPINDTPVRRPEQMLTGPGGGGGDFGMGAIAHALTAIFRLQQAAPASQGLGEGDKPTITYRTWTADSEPDPSSEPRPIYVGALSEEQLRQSCRRVGDVQKWINEAAEILAPKKLNFTGQFYGIALHLLLHQKIQALKRAYPGLYDDLESEISFLQDGTPAYRGEKNSVRYDVYEKIPPDKAETVCIYDAKTGDARFRWEQLQKTVTSATKQNPGATIIVVQMGVGEVSNGPR